MKYILTNAYKTGFAIPALALFSLLLTGCDDDDDDDGNGYLMVYNASSNSPDINLELELDGDIVRTGNFGYSEVSGTYSMEADKYDIELSIPVNSSDDDTIYQDDINISSDTIHFTAVINSIDDVQISNYEFEVEDLDSDDDQFTIRLLNLYEDNQDLNVYIAQSDGDFDDAIFVETVGFQELSDSLYYDTDDYNIYITDSSDNLVFEAEDIAFSFTNQQILVIKENPNTDNDGYVVDRISTLGNVSTIEDEHVTENSFVRFFNAMDENILLPNYDEELDIHISGITTSPLVENLEKSEYSDLNELAGFDYSLDITLPGSQDKLTLLTSEGESSTFASQLLSLPSASNKTVFYYLTEVTEEDDGDDDTTEETELFINTVVTNNDAVEGLYHHEIKVLNFIEELDYVTIYFKGPEHESYSDSPYVVVNTRSVASSINLPNDSYSIIIFEENTLNLVSQTTITLDETSKNQYLVIEDSGSTYAVTRFDQN